MVLRVIPGSDMWDPNNWVDDGHEHRIYADETLEVFAVVDAIDYPYLCQYRWSIHSVDLGNGRRDTRRKKFYLRRGVSIFHAPDGEKYESPIHGHMVRHRNRTQKNVFLHQEVVDRMGLLPPSPLHTRIDHRDRDTMNCRRYNLAWATNSENVKNSDRISPSR